MQLICVSRGTYTGGRQLAERLAKKLGYRCLSREELVDAAIGEGIAVGKMEMAIVKPHAFSERLALEMEHYKAFTTAYLCEQAMREPLVYHGRTGHMLLPGLSHVLRLRVVADEDYRLGNAMARLKLDRGKAREYLRQVDEDVRRWAHLFYGVAWEDASTYDFIVNLEQMNVDNAAVALTAVAQLPDFQMTPASRRGMLNLQTAARARVLLARDERTWASSFKVRANDGVVTVAYLPRDSKVAKVIPEVLSSAEGILEVRTTMAATNILWIQEKYDPQSESFRQVAEIATKWNAAVELLQLAPGIETRTADDGNGGLNGADGPPLPIAATSRHDENGGIEDDTIDRTTSMPGSYHAVAERLAQIGRSGGGRVVAGGSDRLVTSIDKTVPYSLIVIGDVFLDRGHAARLRMTRDLRGLIGDTLKAPVVTSDDLAKQYLFGRRQVVKLGVYCLLAAIIYYLVFTHQPAVAQFLTVTGWKAKTLAAASVCLFTPLVAYIQGSVAELFMKLIKMD